MKHVVAAIIGRDDGKFLIAQRKAGLKLEYKWEFPGGKVEGDEQPEDALARELLEEFGIQCKVNAFVCDSIFHYESVSIRLSGYLTEWVSGSMVLNDHAQIKWVTLREMQQFDLAEADKPMLNKLIELFNHKDNFNNNETKKGITL
jgi:8-oxo-dGTP diphosphatase